MNKKNIADYLIYAPDRAYETLKSLKSIDSLTALAGFALTGYGMYEGDGKKMIAGLVVSLAAGVYGFCRDNFSSKREPVPEVLILEKDKWAR